MGASCAMGNCRNYAAATQGQGIIYHSFPRDLKRQKLWIQKCRRRNKINPNKSHVCSDHFRPDDYVRDLKAELLGYAPRKLLKPTAVPETRPLPDLSVPLTTARRHGSRILHRNLLMPFVKKKVKTSTCDGIDAKLNSSQNLDENADLSATPLKVVTEKPFVVVLNEKKDHELPPEKVMPGAEAVYSANVNGSCTDSNGKSEKKLASFSEFSTGQSENGKPLPNHDTCTVSDESVASASIQTEKCISPFIKRVNETETNKDKALLSSDSSPMLLNVKNENASFDLPIHIISVNSIAPLTTDIQKTTPQNSNLFEDLNLEMNPYKIRRKRTNKGAQTISDEFDYLSLESQVKLLEYRVETLKSTIGNHDLNVINLDSRVRDARNCIKKEVSRQVHQILGKVFAADQINCLMTGIRCKNWSEDTLTKSNAFRKVSKNAYVYLRKKMGYPLPGLTTLKRWNRNNKLKGQKTASLELCDTNCRSDDHETVTKFNSHPVGLLST